MLKWAEAHTVQANSAMQVESSQTDVSKSLAHKVAASRDILPATMINEFRDCSLCDVCAQSRETGYSEHVRNRDWRSRTSVHLSPVLPCDVGIAVPGSPQSRFGAIPFGAL